MSSPGKTAAMSAVAIVLIGYNILSSNESPSPALATLQYVLLLAAAIGLVGSIVKMNRGK
jgi:hypothetical protein